MIPFKGLVPYDPFFKGAKAPDTLLYIYSYIYTFICYLYFYRFNYIIDYIIYLNIVYYNYIDFH